ncbi:MAG: hypothetical protein IPP47_09880 [Bryobacterales bacterium]|nr:hypothetical protein [Bryobacterales bacterium]
MSTLSGVHWPPEALREYAERWHGEDIWATRVDPFQVPVGKTSEPGHLPGRDPKPDYHREFLAWQWWHYGAGVRLSGQAH